MEKLVTVIHVLACAGVIGLVLLQHGKGADMGASFGSGASGSLFGVRGSANLLSRLTALFVAIFFSTSLLLTYLYSHSSDRQSVVKAAVIKQVQEKAPAATPAVPESKQVPQ
ncbi:MAG: preprotein translocase subunit SecG [Methylophilaceae bacterium]|nr:preprotein translocase subunit SecG [Methylophilaceae bacterium]